MDSTTGWILYFKFNSTCPFMKEKKKEKGHIWIQTQQKDPNPNPNFKTVSSLYFFTTIYTLHFPASSQFFTIINTKTQFLKNHCFSFFSHSSSSKWFYEVLKKKKKTKKLNLSHPFPKNANPFTISPYQSWSGVLNAVLDAPTPPFMTATVLQPAAAPIVVQYNEGESSSALAVMMMMMKKGSLLWGRNYCMIWKSIRIDWKTRFWEKE